MFELRILLLVYSFTLVHNQDIFGLNILHYNDFHARYEETGPQGTICNSTNDNSWCIGGFARLTTLVRQAFDREPQSLLLNAGDTYQGTIWFNMLRWRVTQDFINMLPHDAHVFGNHEFGDGIEGLVPYLKHLEAPVVTANIIDDDEPSIQGLYKKSIVVEREGRKIGIIGVVNEFTNKLCNTGQLKFTNEVESVKQEAEKLHNQGVRIIVVLSHSGIEVDTLIAEYGGPHIDIIVGGHSHTLLHNGYVPETSRFKLYGPYPLVIKQDKRLVPIVQAAAYSHYLGEIKLYFDDEGNLLEWKGNTHYIGNEIEQAPDVLEKIKQYRPKINEIAKQHIGTSLVHLASKCKCVECVMGNFVSDAFLHPVKDIAHFSIINQGAMRGDIQSGAITYESVLLTLPFENNVEVFELQGKHIKEMLEFSVINKPYAGANTLQVSGLHVWADGAVPENERVLNVTVRCIDCDIPKYEPLELDKYYTVVSINFLANGGDGFYMISQNRRNVKVIGLDYNIFMDYIRLKSPISAEVEGRLVLSNVCV